MSEFSIEYIPNIPEKAEKASIDSLTVVEDNIRYAVKDLVFYLEDFHSDKIRVCRFNDWHANWEQLLPWIEAGTCWYIKGQIKKRGPSGKVPRKHYGKRSPGKEKNVKAPPIKKDLEF